MGLATRRKRTQVCLWGHGGGSQGACSQAWATRLLQDAREHPCLQLEQLVGLLMAGEAGGDWRPMAPHLTPKGRRP